MLYLSLIAQRMTGPQLLPTMQRRAISPPDLNRTILPREFKTKRRHPPLQKRTCSYCIQTICMWRRSSGWTRVLALTLKNVSTVYLRCCEDQSKRHSPARRPTAARLTPCRRKPCAHNVANTSLGSAPTTLKVGLSGSPGPRLSLSRRQSSHMHLATWCRIGDDDTSRPKRLWRLFS